MRFLSLERLHPVHTLLSQCYELAERQVGEDGVRDVELFIVYGRLWMIILAVWNELNGESDCDMTFSHQVLEAMSADTSTILCAMYG
jgi:hypothetical protein